MVNSFHFPRALIAYTIAIPLALVLGFFLIAPLSGITWMLIGACIFIALLPLLLKHHHLLLIIGWSAFINAFFLPGQPPMWLLLAAMSFGISILDGIITGKRPFMPAPLVSAPLLFIGAVTVMTGLYRGGLGIKAMGGDSFGGKSYFFILGAILGFFALSAKPLPERVARWAVPVFFLSSLTAVLSNIAYLLGPHFYFLFNLFPSDLVLNQVLEDFGIGVSGLDRIVGLSFAGVAFFSFLMVRYGIQGLFDLKKPWRAGMLLLCVVATLFGGFRSLVAWFGLLTISQFFWEKLPKARYLLGFTLITVLAGTVAIGTISKMPLSVQRALSFLPLDVDASVKRDAAGSTEWRFEMWQVISPQIPEYLWMGKGYSIDPTDMYLAEEAVRRGFAKDYEPFIVTGSYHSGPLSTIIPLGIWGAIGLLWLFGAGTVALYRNYRYGNPAHARANTFLLSFFVARIVFFFFVFGAFNTDLVLFTGVLGLSVCLNRGIASKASSKRAALAAAPHSHPHPALQPA